MAIYAIFSLYRVRGGGFAGHHVRCRQWNAQPDFAAAAILPNMEAARAFFGEGALARQLYDCAGWER